MPSAREAIIETRNTPLGISGSFTTDFFLIDGFSNIKVIVNTNVNGILFIEHSTDEINIDYTRELDITTYNGFYDVSKVISKYVRLRYVNGLIAQSTFRIQLILTSIASENSNSVLDNIRDQKKIDGIVNGFIPKSLNKELEDIWEEGGDYNFLTTASTLEIVSNDNDDDIAGIGAQSVILYGLDTNWDEIEEVVDLVGNGTSVPTTQLFIRLNRAEVQQVGTPHGNNEDNLEIEASGVVIGVIVEGEGITKNGVYSVPNNFKMFITKLSVNSGDKKNMIFLNKVENADINTSPKIVIYKTTKIKRPITLLEEIIEVESKSDVWISNFSDKKDQEISVLFSYYLIKSN